MNELVDFLLARISEDEQAAWGNSLAGYNLTAVGQVTATTVGGRRLRSECASKRAIIDACRPVPSPWTTDTELHEHAAHPEWEYATTEGQRKAFDDENVPPEGEGWVRNVERGDKGWERFDYTEESYWRRPRTTPRSPKTEPLILRLLAAPFESHPDFDVSWKVQA